MSTDLDAYIKQMSATMYMRLRNMPVGTKLKITGWRTDVGNLVELKPAAFVTFVGWTSPTFKVARVEFDNCDGEWFVPIDHLSLTTGTPVHRAEDIEIDGSAGQVRISFVTDARGIEPGQRAVIIFTHEQLDVALTTGLELVVAATDAMQARMR